MQAKWSSLFLVRNQKGQEEETPSLAPTVEGYETLFSVSRAKDPTQAKWSGPVTGRQTGASKRGKLLLACRNYECMEPFLPKPGVIPMQAKWSSAG